MRFDPTIELDETELFELIGDIVNYGFVQPGPHAIKRMGERGFTMRGVLEILKNGELIGTEFSEEHQNWKYKIRGIDLDGDEGTTVSAIIGRNTICLITVC